ncbi:MAG: hypothetical protein QXL94_00885, partial [Candidatus Parvarchaeum sp.]
MTRLYPGTQEDNLKSILLNDFSGGLNTYKSSINLNANESPACLNVIPMPGRLITRGGWFVQTPLSGTNLACDLLYYFEDYNGGNHIMMFAGGNLYDVTQPTAVEIGTNVYTANQQVGCVDIGGYMYFSTENVPLSKYDAPNQTITVVTKSSITGAVPPPMSPYLTLYSGSIVAIRPNFPGNGYYPNSFAWSAVNDPT